MRLLKISLNGRKDLLGKKSKRNEFFGRQVTELIVVGVSIGGSMKEIRGKWICTDM